MILSFLHCSPLVAANLKQINRCLAGHVLDLTSNHDKDERIWSSSLGLRRDLYVYLPPGFDRDKTYPLFLWLHGFGGDEKQFLTQIVKSLDDAIVAGRLPPMIAACPDGSIPSQGARAWKTGSWFINTSRGKWEDYIVDDVLGYLHENFPIRPERESHVVAGWSMGGFGAYNLGFKHPEYFGHLVGIYPNLDLRYFDSSGSWNAKFCPDSYERFDDLRWHWILGYWRNTIPISAAMVYMPVWGRGPEAARRMAEENPVELLDVYDVQPGQFDMYIAYGRWDEYNIDAQSDSFLHAAQGRGLDVWVRVHPRGYHTSPYVNECMPDVFAAIGARMRAKLAGLSNALPCEAVLGGG